MSEPFRMNSLRYANYTPDMVERVIYAGIPFRRYDGRRYFSPGQADRARGIEDLHREVWKRERGAIPDGWHIHHLDGDPGNNEATNLACITPAEHEQIHAADRSALASSPEQLAHLTRIRSLAARWHSTPEGLAWHREHGAASWNRREARRATCARCGEEYETRSRKGDEQYCSAACKAAARRRRGDDNITKVCVMCGTAYSVNRYSKSSTCSPTCRANLRWSRRAT